MMADNMHFPDDIHEKYLLGKMTETEREAYEAELRESPDGGRQLESKKLIISSIRAAGRAEMKDEIRSQVARMNRTGTSNVADWSMILKIAAVLCMVAIVPYLYYQSQQFDEFGNSQTLSSEPILAKEKASEFDLDNSADQVGLDELSRQASPRNPSVATKPEASGRARSNRVGEKITRATS